MSGKGKYIFLVFFCAMGRPFFSFAQEVNLQRWNYIYTYFPITENVKYHADYGDRNEFPARNYFRLHARPAIRIETGEHFSLEIGFGFFRIWQVDAANTYEYRPYFGYHLEWRFFDRLEVELRLRFEERFIQSATRELAASLRLREKLEVVVPLNHREESKPKTWFLLASYELFQNNGNIGLQPFVDQTRWQIGGGYRLNKHYKFTLVYLRRTNINKAANGEDIINPVIRSGFYFAWGE